MVSALLWCVLAQAPDAGTVPYEDRLIAWGLEQHGRALHPAPDGQRIDEVLIASENIFAPSDSWPLFLNWFHARTRESVIRREVLLAPGDTWTPARVMETERNLRRLFILAVVKVVPVTSPSGGVAALVVTKDRWSLRLSNSFTLVGPLLQQLRLSLTEINFNGWGQNASLDFQLRLDTLSFGQTFIERRLFGSRLYFGETASIILNRQTGKPEGTVGTITFGRPVITLDQTWGFLATADWNLRRRRVFRGADIWQLEDPSSTTGETVPLVYDVREISAEASVTRSFGRALKLDLTGALGGYTRQYAPPPGTLSDEQSAWLTATYLPRSENVTYASAYARAFPADFIILRNIDAFELSEDYQVGWLAQAGVRWAFPLPFAPSSFVEGAAALRYRLYRGDDLLTMTVAAGARARPGQSLANQHVAAEVSNYSPLVYGGRFVVRVLLDVIQNDLNNRQVLLGGSTGLRGAYAEQFTGRNLVLGNVEYRTRAIEILTTWFGLVAFYDVGSAYDVRPVLTHSVGIGLRVMLPHLNREVLRFDFGIVLAGPGPGVDRLNASWSQVTDIRPTFLDQPM
ncbi:MAG: hypothetical protein JNG84_11020 [Archangium sp.]|nr:hypothetical protein [Archangium sp.]